MKPSVGRIVHVLVDPKQNNGSDVAAAAITRVWSDTCVNLRVWHDGPSVPPEGSFRQDWLTSWPLHESREAAAEVHAARVAEFGPGYTIALSAAFWPPRVEHQPGDRPATF
jgi:hypothetical protein